MAISEIIKARRAALKLTQQQVADRAGMGQSVYARLESGGRVNVRADTIRRVAKALRMSPAKLLAASG